MDHKQARAIAAEVGPDLLIEEGVIPYIDVRRHKEGHRIRIILPQDMDPECRLSIEARRNIVSEALKSVYQYLPEPPPPPPDPAELAKVEKEILKQQAIELKRQKEEQEALVQEMVRREIANKEAEFMRVMSQPKPPPADAEYATVIDEETEGPRSEKPKTKKK